MRFVAVLAFAFLVIAGSRADAQVFKPRGGKATKTAKKPAAEKAEKPAAEKPTKKARVAKTTPKKKSRAAESGRPSDLTPTPVKKGKKGRASKIDEDDEVASSDAGDDEVIITDDDD